MSLTSDSIITLEHVAFSRGSRPIFKGVDITVQRGKVTAILGPSGTGKTTLLYLIGGLIKAQKGCVSVMGQDMHKVSNRGLLKLRERIGMLFQSGALFTDLSVYDNVAFPIREHTRLPETLIHNIVLMKLEAVGLRGAQDLMPSELSGGMSRRVALARAIALDPEIMLYDEPFAGQDPISMGVLLKLIRVLNDALGLSSIVVSHDVEEVLGIADYVYVLADGVIAGSGTPEEIRQATSPKVQQFIQGQPDGPVPFHYPATGILEAYGVNHGE